VTVIVLRSSCRRCRFICPHGLPRRLGRTGRSGQETEGGVEHLPGRNPPNRVGQAYGFLDLPVAEAGPSRRGDMVLDTGHAVATQRRTECDELPFSTAQSVHSRSSLSILRIGLREEARTVPAPHLL
jgi:hypothetical protein